MNFVNVIYTTMASNFHLVLCFIIMNVLLLLWWDVANHWQEPMLTSILPSTALKDSYDL